MRRRCSWCESFEPKLAREGDLFRVSCGKCGASGPAGTREYAIDQWNKGSEELRKAYNSKATEGLKRIAAEAERDGWKARCKKLFDDSGETVLVMTTCAGEETSVTKESRVCDQAGCGSGLPPDVCRNCLDAMYDSFLKTMKRISSGAATQVTLDDADRCEKLERELKRLRALLMTAVTQACSDRNGKLQHYFMTAWENIFEYLEDVGLMTGNERDGFDLKVDAWDELDRTE